MIKRKGYYCSYQSANYYGYQYQSFQSEFLNYKHVVEVLVYILGSLNLENINLVEVPVAP